MNKRIAKKNLKKAFKEMESSRGKSQLMSYLFRANYNLLDRYLFTFSLYNP